MGEVKGLGRRRFKGPGVMAVATAVLLGVVGTTAPTAAAATGTPSSPPDTRTSPGSSGSPGTSGAPETSGTPGTRHARAVPGFWDGVWRMDGYGTVLTINGRDLQEYQVTAVSCLKGTSARRTDAAGPEHGTPNRRATDLRATSRQATNLQATNRQAADHQAMDRQAADRQATNLQAADRRATAPHGSGRPVADRYTTADGDVARLWRAGGRDRAMLHWDGSAGDRRLRRVPALPSVCTRGDEPGTMPKDRLTTFDVFWQTFEENYPFFAAKGIDWHAVRDRYRPKVRAGVSDEELFAVFRDMVAPLNDAHVAVFGPGKPFSSHRPGTVPPSEAYDKRVRAHLREHPLKGLAYREFAKGRIGFAELPGGQGYLRVSGFAGFADANTFAANSAALDEALDAVLTRERVARMRGLVIDVRINGGGSDTLGLRLAARLTDRPYFAYAKRARNHPTDPTRFTRPQPLYVRPAAAPRYTGPVAVLTSGSTVSAGETFTQALMERPGRTVRIGEPTQGVFSDVLIRALPNGWAVGLPNEQFLTRSGHAFDGPGIPPHIPVPVFTPEEFAHGRDSALARAVTELSRKR
ncbi:S41 family peptidase [Streptomyces sp. NPDC003077]|uniref:S41 family peptidase n=1 Tax=Streptomyces sp. NPDC003077 TaxID=3154443 RepID=UPI0033ACCFDB